MPAPAAFPAVALIAGVAAGVLAPSLRSAAVPVLFAMCLLSAYAWRTRRDRTFAIAVLLGFVAAGSVLGAARIGGATRPPLREFFDESRDRADQERAPVVVEGVIRQDATPTEYGVSMTLDVTRVQTPCGWLPAPGGLRVAINGDLARARVDSWRAGRRVRLPALLRLPSTFRNPGVADEAFGLTRRGIALTGSAKSGSLVEVVARGHAAAELAAAARAYARRAIASAIPNRPVAAAIVTAILVGDRGGLDPHIERRLQEAGTYHVIAISGGNVAILAGLAFVLLRTARIPTRAGSLVLACVICAYGYLAGGGASVARATMAATMYLAATAADHRSPALNVLAMVALIAVIYDPLGVFDPGLLLSYGATLALLIGVDRILGRTGAVITSGREGADVRTPRRVRPAARPVLPSRAASACLGLIRTVSISAFSAARLVLIGTVCAELALFPIAASIFHRISLAGLALNFAAIPLMTVAQVAGLAVLILYPLAPALATVAGIPGGLAAEGLIWSTRLVDAVPWVTWRVPTPPIGVVALYYAGVVALLLARRGRAWRALGGAATATAALAIASPALIDGLLVHRSPAATELRVSFLDVGQGDSILVQFPGGTSLLIDATGLPRSSFDLGERVITPALLALGVRRLRYLAITHGDPDHVEGAPGVLLDFNPRELWEGVPVPPHETLRTLRALTARAGGAARLVRADDRVTIGAVELRVLHPTEPDWERQRVRNDDSIVMELRYGDVSIVLTGDIGAAVEESLSTKLSDAPIRILKAAHHGSATSSSDAWLSAAHPAAVIISCGRDNRYGHPAPVVLQRLAAHKAEIFRTDLDGAITVTTDGTSVAVTTFTGRHLRFSGQLSRRGIPGWPER